MPFKEKRHAGTGYPFRILILALNLTVVEVLLHIAYWLRYIWEKGTFLDVFEEISDIHIYMGEQFSGMEIIALAIALIAAAGLLILEWHIQIRGLDGREEPEKLMKSIGYRKAQIYRYEVVYLGIDMVAAYSVSVLFFSVCWWKIKELEKIQLLCNYMKVESLVYPAVFFLIGVYCMISVLAGCHIKYKS